MLALGYPHPDDGTGGTGEDEGGVMRIRWAWISGLASTWWPLKGALGASAVSCQTVESRLAEVTLTHDVAVPGWYLTSLGRRNAL